MRDITHKSITLREATARTGLRISPATMAMIREGRVPKGDPLTIARVAALQAVKLTPSIIPFCHPVPIESTEVTFETGDDWITADVTVKAIYRTGVEMEALTAAAAAVLNLYDVLKMVDDTMAITGVELLSKTGGNGQWHKSRREAGLRAAVLVSSDSVAAGKKQDRSGRLLAERLEAEGLEVVETRILPDEPESIARQLRAYADEGHLNLVLTTGGTGFGPRDCMPEAMDLVIEREAPGIVEAARAYGQQRTPLAMLSRGRAGVRGRTLIVNLPGSSRGAAEGLEALMPYMLHAYKMLRGEGHPESEKHEATASKATS